MVVETRSTHSSRRPPISPTLAQSVWGYKDVPLLLITIDCQLDPHLCNLCPSAISGYLQATSFTCGAPGGQCQVKSGLDVGTAPPAWWTGTPLIAKPHTLHICQDQRGSLAGWCGSGECQGWKQHGQS